MIACVRTSCCDTAFSNDADGSTGATGLAPRSVQAATTNSVTRAPAIRAALGRGSIECSPLRGGGLPSRFARHHTHHRVATEVLRSVHYGAHHPTESESIWLALQCAGIAVSQPSRAYPSRSHTNAPARHDRRSSTRRSPRPHPCP